MWSGPYTAQGSEGFDIYKLFNEQKMSLLFGPLKLFTVYARITSVHCPKDLGSTERRRNVLSVIITIKTKF